MKRSSSNGRLSSHLSASLSAGVVTLLCMGLFVAASASASYELVGHFAGTAGSLMTSLGAPEANWPEEVQFGGIGGMAVNYTGAGGVPVGTIYSVGKTLNRGGRIARYNPNGSFSEAWNPVGSPPNLRCGPEGDPATPVCTSSATADTEGLDIDVDQATGYVYVLIDNAPVGQDRVHVYTADGSKMIAEFGEQAGSTETIAGSPQKVHSSFGPPQGIAVNAADDVYIYDSSGATERLMEFEPQSPDDHEHYVYAGQDHDIIKESGRPVRQPVADVAGNLYVTNGDSVFKLDPSQPEAPPLCKFTWSAGGILAITVNPIDGEVFFYDYKDKKVHRLSPCSEGSFSEAGATRLLPARVEIGGMAFDPVRRFAPGRPPGVLYAGSPNSEGGKTEPAFEESSLGYIFAPPLELQPVIESESVSHVTASTAVVAAQINPENSATRYVFQYVTNAQYEENEAGEPFLGAVEVPLGGGLAGEGKEMVGVSGTLAGLLPDTSYRYRVVASSNCSVEDPEKVCLTAGGTVGFHTYARQDPGVLPDGRVYEMVSPPEKDGGQVLPADPSVDSCQNCKSFYGSVTVALLSAADGNAVAFRGSSFSSEGGSVLDNEYVARRDGTVGWQTSDPTPILLETKPGANGGYEAFSSDLRDSVLQQPHTALTADAPADYANLYAQSGTDPSALTPMLTAAPPNRPGGTLEVRYAGASADLSRVFFAANDALTEEVPGVAPAAVDGGPAKFNLYEWTEGRLSLVNVMPGNTVAQPGGSFGTPDARAISDDGTRVFFSDEAGQVYVREDGQSTKEITTNGVPDAGRFVVAAADGSVVLLADGHLHGLGDEEPTVDLTQGKGGVQGLAGQSDDLSHIYFVDTSVLTGEEENEHCTVVAGKRSCEKATANKDNLYSWTKAAGTRFVGTLISNDNEDFSPLPARRTAQASPHGRYVAFMSAVPLTGYDNTGPCETDHQGGYVSALCAEVFLYDSQTSKLVCASCNPSGEHPLGPSVLRRIDGSSNLPLPRYLSDEGRLFFDSQDSLAPVDTNGRVEDVYEYEPEGVGSCERLGGCVSLISSGTGLYDSNFFASEASGANVFFTTSDRLVGRDRDEAIDLYDARVDGGIPVETETASGECHGEACQPPVSVTQGLSAPTSFSFVGAGNVKETASAPRKKSARKKPKHKKHKKGRRAKRSNRRTVRHNRGGAK